jgi:hypothetical protein
MLSQAGQQASNGEELGQLKAEKSTFLKMWIFYRVSQ